MTPTIRSVSIENIAGVSRAADRGLGDPVELDAKTLRRLRLDDALNDPLLVNVPVADAVNLQSIGEWLVTSVGEFGAPLCFEFGDGTLISERGFWLLVTQLCDGPVEIISSYVRRVLELHDHNLDAMHDRESSVPGEEALYALMDARITPFTELFELPAAEEFAQFVDLFTDFMACCDHGHGVRQEERMKGLVRVFQDRRLLRGGPESRSFEQYVRLAAVFEHDGPWDSRDKSDAARRHRATQPGVFKPLLEHLIGRDHPPEYLPLPRGASDYAEGEYRGTTEGCVPDLIEAVYGTDPAREEVYQWVQSRCGVNVRSDKAAMSDWDRSRLDLIDAALARGEVICDNNGFHRFDQTTNKWLALEADDSTPG